MSSQIPGRDRSEYGFAGLLGAVAVLLTVDALSLDLPEGRVDKVGPVLVPLVVAGLLLACAITLAIEVSRGKHGAPQEGEDVELSSPIEWRTVIPLVLVLMATALLVNTLGWVIAGTLLFFGSVWSLGSRHFVRDLLISVALSVSTFYGFYSGLGIYLPAGPLEGIL